MDCDWKYCPHCGMEKRDEVHLFEDSVDKVKREFKRVVGRVMDDDEIDKIRGQYTLKIWID